MWCGLGTSGFFFFSRMGKNTTPGIFSQYSTTGWDTARDKQRLPEKIGRITRFALNQWGCDNLILYNSHLIYLFFFFYAGGVFTTIKYLYLLYKHQWNTRWAFARKLGIFTSENNMLSSHVKISPLLRLHNKSRLHTKKLFKWNGLVFHWCLDNK